MFEEAIMRTDNLIHALATNLQPAPRHLVSTRILLGVVAGVLASLALLFALIGPRPDLLLALGTTSFWSKAAYIATTAAMALWVVARLARPGTSAKEFWLLAVPVAIYLPVVVWELAHTDQTLWGSMLLGHGWRLCTWLVLGLSMPVFAGLLWAFRGFAPTHSEIAGAAAGVCSGAVAGIVYCLHCPTDTALFAFAWYTLAFTIAGGLGAMLGRRFLRW
jgi:hypothetical protein